MLSYIKKLFKHCPFHFGLSFSKEIEDNRNVENSIFKRKETSPKCITDLGMASIPPFDQLTEMNRVNPSRFTWPLQFGTKTNSEKGASILSKSIVKNAPLAAQSVLTEQHRKMHQRNLYAYFLTHKKEISKSSREDIVAIIEHCVNLAIAPTEKIKEEICTLFSELALLPQEKFNRLSAIAKKENLQRILSSKLDQLLIMQRMHQALHEDEQHQLEMSIARAQLAIKLGKELTCVGGTNGAMIVKSLESDVIGFFKGASGQALEMNKEIKSFFCHAKLYSRRDPIIEPNSEFSMAYLSQLSGFDFAPDAKMIELKNKQGSFLAFV